MPYLVQTREDVDCAIHCTINTLPGLYSIRRDTTLFIPSDTQPSCVYHVPNRRARGVELVSRDLKTVGSTQEHAFLADHPVVRDLEKVSPKRGRGVSNRLCGVSKQTIQCILL